jgi:hypothetical protein
MNQVLGLFEVEHGHCYVGNMEQTNGTECGALKAVSIKITVAVWGTGTSILEELETSN